MTSQVKDFLQKYKYLLSTGERKTLLDLIITAYDVLLDKEQRKELLEEILPKVISPHLITSLCYERLELYILEELEYWRNSYWRNASGSWARLQQILRDIRHDFTYYEVVTHLLQAKNRLGLEMIPLEDIYGYDGPDDYDLLGIFDKQEYERENPDLFGG